MKKYLVLYHDVDDDEERKHRLIIETEDKKPVIEFLDVVRIGITRIVLPDSYIDSLTEKE